MKSLPKIFIWTVIALCLLGIGIIVITPLTYPHKKISLSIPQHLPSTFSKIQQPIPMQDRIFTLVSVQKNFPASPADQLSSSEQLIAATVSLENTGKEIITYSPYDFFVQDTTGKLHAPIFVFQLSDEYMLGSGKLSPGAKKTGTIVFTVEKANKPFVFLYKPFMENKKNGFGAAVKL